MQVELKALRLLNFASAESKRKQEAHLSLSALSVFLDMIHQCIHDIHVQTLLFLRMLKYGHSFLTTGIRWVCLDFGIPSSNTINMLKK